MSNSERNLQEFLGDHLPYEINMLRSTFTCLSLGVFTGALQNALIESYAIHARNLLEFFCRDSNAWPVTELCDVSYTPMARPQSLFRKISSQIAHLTGNRTTDQSKKLNATDPYVLEAIENEIERFSRHLRGDLRGLFKVTSSRIQVISTSG